MYRELILSLSEKISFVKIQPPASEREIARAEKALGHRFPQPLKELLGELNGDRWLLKSVDDICETAQCHREYLLESCPQIDRNIFFADNGCGDCYGYRVADDGTVDESAIWMWEHETDSYHVVAYNISELIQRCYRDEI